MPVAGGDGSRHAFRVSPLGVALIDGPAGASFRPFQTWRLQPPAEGFPCRSIPKL